MFGPVFRRTGRCLPGRPGGARPLVPECGLSVCASSAETWQQLVHEHSPNEWMNDVHVRMHAISTHLCVHTHLQRRTHAHAHTPDGD